MNFRELPQILNSSELNLKNAVQKSHASIQEQPTTRKRRAPAPCGSTRRARSRPPPRGERRRRSVPKSHASSQEEQLRNCELDLELELVSDDTPEPDTAPGGESSTTTPLRSTMPPLTSQFVFNKISQRELAPPKNTFNKFNKISAWLPKIRVCFNILKISNVARARPLGKLTSNPTRPLSSCA